MMRFPPYAYVPGHRPHPTRSEAGHSFGVAEQTPEPMAPDQWRDCAPYLEGLELFNAGYYWEAHEAWEGLWVAAGRAGAMGEFFQGLIKLSVAGLKVRQCLPDKVVAMGAAAGQHFARARAMAGREQLGGLLLGDLIAFAEAVRTRGDQLKGSPEPAVEVVFDWRLRPRVLRPSQLDEITSTTIGHYNLRADAFWEGTRDHDVTQNRSAMLRHVEGEGALTILDLGCGPGRDLIAFTEMGHEAIGLDGAERFCELARKNSGCEVLHQNFLDLDLPRGRFDAVFANASLFHVPTQELSAVLDELRASLVDRGVLFCSNPRGPNEEGWHGDRYGAYHDHARWTRMVTARGFEELEHYYRPPGRPRAQQPWLATVFRRVA